MTVDAAIPIDPELAQRLLHTALATLEELARTATDPTERRRAATTILRFLSRPLPRPRAESPRHASPAARQHTAEPARAPALPRADQHAPSVATGHATDLHVPEQPAAAPLLPVLVRTPVRTHAAAAHPPSPRHAHPTRPTDLLHAAGAPRRFSG